MSKDKLPFESGHLMRLAWSLETGLRAGRDWISVFEWISQNDANSEVKLYLKSFLQKIKFESTEKVLRSERSRVRSLEWMLFFEILMQAQRGSPNLSQIFQSYAKTSFSIQKLKQKETSLLFIPRFQTWVSLAIVVAFTIALPVFFPGLFPTFLSLRRYDLFFMGFAYMGMGFFVLHCMCQKPKRLLDPILRMTFFFYLLALFVESGIDFSSAWHRALEAIPFDDVTMKILKSSHLKTETTDDFLRKVQMQLQQPWPEILSGIIWAKTAGIGLSAYLKSISEKEGERLMFQWEDEVRKLTMTSLIPLGVIIFPATLFLLVGPQLLQLMQLS